ncbi:MAG TPA: DNA-3-methyladenine glycosylase 2 family protein [Gammaproteobacteria bacterium]|nr:DNA-3-methyladenine glycosylase 2 family protein [Gammaproteobacteria bacterium]
MTDLSTSNLDEACRYLSQRDKGLARIIIDVGACTLEIRSNRSVFEYLCRSIVYQQLSGKAAGTIHGRMLDLFARRRASADALLNMPMERLRAAGLSRSKSLALYDLSEKQVSGLLPTRRQLNRMTDQEIIDALSQVRGIGEWTVQMLLIFYLGRPDVLPSRDLGVQKGYQKMRRSRELPEPSRLARAGLRWRPYRSVATWYLWRCLEIELPTS